MPSVQHSLHFWKMHAAGNVLLLFDTREVHQQDWSRLSVATADAHRAVGHDGILVVSVGGEGHFGQRMFNPDGTEDFCGNGLRCTAKHLHDRGDIGSEVVCIETAAGARRVQVLSGEANKATVRSELGRADVREVRLTWRGRHAQAVPGRLRRELTRAIFVDIGTPHLVLLVDHELPDDEWGVASAYLERHSGTSDAAAARDPRTSVVWLLPEAPDSARVRIWERAIGETLSCGTGAAAALAAGQLRGALAESARISSPGGVLEVCLDSAGTLWVTGPAETICEGSWPV
ncbi:MAG: diaminopimelate epimerase [Armatimonadota bacterium]